MSPRAAATSKMMPPEIKPALLLSRICTSEVIWRGSQTVQVCSRLPQKTQSSSEKVQRVELSSRRRLYSEPGRSCSNSQQSYEGVLLICSREMLLWYILRRVKDWGFLKLSMGNTSCPSRKGKLVLGCRWSSSSNRFRFTAQLSTLTSSSPIKAIVDWAILLARKAAGSSRSLQKRLSTRLLPRALNSAMQLSLPWVQLTCRADLNFPISVQEPFIFRWLTLTFDLTVRSNTDSLSPPVRQKKGCENMLWAGRLPPSPISSTSCTSVTKAGPPSRQIFRPVKLRTQNSIESVEDLAIDLACTKSLCRSQPDTGSTFLVARWQYLRSVQVAMQRVELRLRREVLESLVGSPSLMRWLIVIVSGALSCSRTA